MKRVAGVETIAFSVAKDQAMTAQRRYLDFNATAPVRPAVRVAMDAVPDWCGNPSSVHAEGRAARALVEKARAQVARIVGATPKNVIFTSGGTEAVNLALTPHVRTPGFSGAVDHLLMAETEHACVLNGHRFPKADVGLVPVDRQGRIDLDALDCILRGLAGKKVMLALQWANNETGVVQPVRAAAMRVHAHRGIVVCDAVQGLAKTKLDIRAIDADMMVVSGHKIGGPKGVGALVLTDGIEIADSVFRGGGQERGFRAGTENVPAIVGFGAACAAVEESEIVAMERLRNDLERVLRAIGPDVLIFGAAVERLPNTCAFALPGWSAETLLIGLDLEGIAVSSGSACSSGKVARSHVLQAMKVAPEFLAGAIRVSLGWASTDADVAAFGTALAAVLRRAPARSDKAA